MNQNKDLSSLSYYQGIYDDYILLGNGDFVFGYRLWFPPLWTSGREDFNEIDDSILSLLKRLPDNTTTQWSYYVFDSNHRSDLSKANNRIELEDLKSWDRRKVLNLYCEVYITLSNSKLNKISETDNPFIRAKKYLTEKPFRDMGETIERFNQVVNTVTKTLEQNPLIDANRLSSEDLMNSIKRYFTQGYDKADLSTVAVNPDISYEDGIMKVGNEYVGMVSLVKEGEKVVSSKTTNVVSNPYSDVDLPLHVTLPSSMAFDLTTGIPFPHIYNVCIEKIDNDSAFDELNKKKGSLKLLAFLGSGKATNIRNEIGGEKGRNGEILSSGFIDVVEKFNYQVTRCRVNIIVKDKSKTVLADKIEFLINSFAMMNGSDAVAENGHLANLFMASAPGCMRFNYRYVWNIGHQSVRYLVKESLYKSDKKGLRFVDRTGTPITINTWNDNGHIVNNNAVLFAPSGSGKSVLLNGIVNQYYAQSHYVIIIDVGGSFKRNTIINEGYYFDAGIKDNLQFNIFLCDQDKQGNYIYQPNDDESEDGKNNDHINFVASILIRLWKGDEGITREAKAVLKKTIIGFYEWINKNKGIPTLKHYHKFLEAWQKKASEKHLRYFDVEAFLLVLDEYVDGQYDTLLNSKDNMKLTDQRLLVFDLEAIKDNKDISEIVIAIVMYYAAEIINTKDERKAYIVDEAIDYLKGDMGDFIAGLYRKIRKRNGQAIISTQGIGYLNELSDLVKKSIFGNTSTVWLLSHKDDKASYPLLKEQLDLTEGELAMLDSVGRGDGYREVLLKMGTTFCEVIRMQISKFSLLSFTTDPEEVQQLERNYRKSKSHVSAILDYLETKENKERKEAGKLLSESEETEEQEAATL